MNVKYYPINEDAAKRAKDAYSYFDYVPGSATTSYRVMVDEAAVIAARQKDHVDPMYHDKIDGLLDRYARKLAEVINKGNEIDARVPSILIAGGSNFNVRAKEKQNAARDSNEARYTQVQGLLSKIKSVGMGGIMSDDKNAVEKLSAKLAGLEAMQDKMKAVNAYYRKHKTLVGCPELTEEARLRLESGMSGSVHDAPYPSWALSNNNANIRRIKDRLAELEKEAQRAAENADAGPVEGDGYKLVENTELGRIQFIFEGKPDESTRALLKANGFKWAPSQGAWQRMLNDHGRYAAQKVRDELDAIPQF